MISSVLNNVSKLSSLQQFGDIVILLIWAWTLKGMLFGPQSVGCQSHHIFKNIYCCVSNAIGHRFFSFFLRCKQEWHWVCSQTAVAFTLYYVDRISSWIMLGLLAPTTQLLTLESIKETLSKPYVVNTEYSPKNSTFSFVSLWKWYASRFFPQYFRVCSKDSEEYNTDWHWPGAVGYSVFLPQNSQDKWHFH